jgi:4'-phosphopantetheinyl transferase
MTPEIAFPPAPENLNLSDDEICIFCALLDLPLMRLQCLEKTLSEDERQRAARFHFKKDRNRFVAGRVILREILGQLVGVDPDELIFSHGVHGKPRLAMLPNAKTFLHFNLAHSDSLAVYAVSRRHEVGIDIERIRAIPEARDVAMQFFGEHEYKWWCLLPDDKKMEGFFNCWVRKEALLKALGTGFNEALNQTDILFAGDLPNSRKWTFRSLIPASNYTAALAVKCKHLRVNCWNWERKRFGHPIGQPATLN